MNPRIRDLLAEPALELQLVSPSSEEELNSEIRWVASSDLVDPTPFLSGGELVLTTGGGIRMRDSDAWDAYAGRLMRVPVAGLGFAIGLRHRQVPPALVRAASASQLPLFEVPYHVPFVKISHFVAEAIFAQRFWYLERGSALAARLATGISAGAPLVDSLRHIAEELQGPVAILGIDGTVVSSWPPHHKWRIPEIFETGRNGEAVRVFPLDSVGVRDHVLVARSTIHDQYYVDTVVSATSTLVAIDLSRRLTGEANSTTRMVTLLDAITDWTTPLPSLVRGMRASGLAPDLPTLVVAAKTLPSDTSMYSLRLRLMIQAAFSVVQSVRRGDGIIVFAQGGDVDSPERVCSELTKRLANRPIVIAGPANDAEELRLVVASARAGLASAAGPTRAPAFDVTAIIAAAVGRGGSQAAVKFLQPLVERDERQGGELVETLRAFLRSDGRPTEAAASLHVHRNTLRYRLGRISDLLNVDLTTLEGMTMCSIALRFYDSIAH